MTLINRNIALFCSILFFTSCEEESPDLATILTTEEVVYTSGDRVILAGRLHSFQNELIDHGFEISREENFANPISIQLGKTSSKGRFLGTYENLRYSLSYYFRAFANDGNQIFYGDINEFQTLKPQITSFTPNVGRENDILQVVGANFTKDARVFFDEAEAMVVESSFESFLEVSIPEISQNQKVYIKVICQDTMMVFPSRFEYIIGIWEKVSEFTDKPQLLRPVFIDKPEAVYLGFGQITGSVLNHSFWKIDKQSLIWTLFPSPSGSTVVDGPLNFRNGFGTGRSGTGLSTFNLTNESWLLSENEEWIESIELPFRLYKGIAVELLENTFVFGGMVEDRTSNRKTYRYNPIVNEWEIVSERLPFIINSDGAYFTHLDQFYYLNKGQELWKFNSVHLEWNKLVDLPFNLGTKNTAKVIDNKVYMLGLGINSEKILELDLQTNSVLEKTPLPGQLGEVSSEIWSYSGKMYVIKIIKTVSLSTTDRIEIWELDPMAF